MMQNYGNKSDYYFLKRPKKVAQKFIFEFIFFCGIQAGKLLVIRPLRLKK